MAVDPAQIQATLDGELAKFVEAAGSPERQAEVLIKIGFYRQELAKQADMLSSVDDDLAIEVAEQWFGEGDELLKRAVWNASAGSEEIPLRKQAPVPEAEQALAKMVDECQTDNARALLLHKIGSYTREMNDMVDALQGQPDARVNEVVTAWLTADPGETALKKNVLTAGMPSSGRRLYGNGVDGDGDPVKETIGNASSHVGNELDGSEKGSDQAIRRTIPRRPTGEGAGKRVRGSFPAPNQRDGETPSPGSGPNDTGDGGVNPEIIRRKGTTGGLGSVKGADAESNATVTQDSTHGTNQWGGQSGGKNRKRSNESDQGVHTAQKAEFIADLMKIAPDEMVDAILELPEDDQDLAAGVAANHAADLLAWTGLVPEGGLAKRALDASVTEWLEEDPDQIQLKKWVAEALTTAEEIPLDLGKAIIEWEPAGPQFTVRREVGKSEVGGGLRKLGPGGQLARTAAIVTGAHLGAGAAVGAAVAAGHKFKKAPKHTLAHHLGYSMLFNPVAYGGYRAGRAIGQRPRGD
jgi:hypothetical protein